MIEGKNIMITGGAGFIGSTLVSYLIEKNQVIVFDSFRRDALSRQKYSKHPNLKIVTGNIMDTKALESVMTDINIIVHCAGIAGISTVALEPVNTMLTNMVGTAKVMEAALKLSKLERFVNFSTSEVFGQSAFNSDESDSSNIGAVGEARWTYAVSKLSGEHLAFAYNRQFRMPTVTVRPFNIYGPGQIGEGAIHVFIRRAINDEEIYIFGEGTQIRAWCYIDDMIDGLLKVIIHPKAVGESFNIGNARAITTILGLAETVCRVLESKSKIVFRPALSTDIELRIPSVKKAQDIIGFNSKVDLHAGILKTARWYREHEDKLSELPKAYQ